MSGYILKNTDRKILYELDQNARIGYKELGTKIKMPKETVKYRIKNLEERGIIYGYYTVINLSRLGFIIYRVYLRLQDTTPELEAKIREYMIKSEKVAVFYNTNGPYHIALGIWITDMWTFQEFWNEFKSSFGQYLSDYELTPMTTYIEFSREYLRPDQSNRIDMQTVGSRIKFGNEQRNTGNKYEKTTFDTISKSEKAKLDNLDLQLLVLVSNNARLKLTEIAKALKISVVTARQHMRKLTKLGVIIGFRPILNLNALGREYYKVDIWLNQFQNKQKIWRYVVSQPEVTYTETTISGGDIEIDLEVTGFNQFNAIMDSLKAEFPGEIREYRYYSMTKNNKTSYMPATKGE